MIQTDTTGTISHITFKFFTKLRAKWRSDGAHHRLRRGSDTSREQKHQNPCPSSLMASDMSARVQQWLSVHDNKLRSGILLAFFRLC